METAFDNGLYSTDDVIAFVMPLFKEVLSFHENNQVSPFEREVSLFITDNRLDVDENFAHSSKEEAGKVLEVFAKNKVDHFNVVGKLKINTNIDDDSQSVQDLLVHLKEDDPIEHPVYVLGYKCFEILLGHHDEQTDIFCLGLILGSTALGLNLYDVEDLKLFVEYRLNPSQFNSRIHPTISTLIIEMTELDRSKRSQDLYDVIHKLEHYRDFDPEKQKDLSKVAGWIDKELTDRSQFILNKLRNRLFDNSRRNRLLYYKPNMRFVNLTVSSVPTVLHYQSIRPDLLFTWNEEISSKVKGMKDILLNKYLRFEDHTYLPSALDKIRVEAQRDIQDFGFSQLKMVISFLNWHNLKEDKNERIQSPLLLLPVKLIKNKKLKEDHFVIEILDNTAEVNPVVANLLRDLYGFKLPDFIDLEEMSLEEFYKLLKTQIDSANQGITINYIDKPRIKLIHSVAKQTVNNYKKRLRKKGELFSYKNISYSYQNEHYKPLGLEIFRQRIEPRAAYLEFLINDDIQTTSNRFTGTTKEKERQLFELAESESNPYSWDFDICNVVLGNFNYKKMSLVRDYNQVIDEKVQNNVFEKLFSNEPKQYNEQLTDLSKIEEWYPVITADPTQTKAILQSRTAENYVIQGPPGTGKSQTITNLIADFVARGKSILFVCEKRAALDIVYHRLKQQGLDELCCYIHDSQEDKRAFIKNLKSTYEDFIKNTLDLKEIQQSRLTLIKKLNEELNTFKLFHDANSTIFDFVGIETRKLIERVIELRQHLLNIEPSKEEAFPHYTEWIKFGDSIKNLSETLEEIGAEPAFAEHPFSKLNDSVFLSENPHKELESLVFSSGNLITEINRLVKEKNIPEEFTEYLPKIKELMEDAMLLRPLVINNHMQLLQMESREAKEYDERIYNYKSKQKQQEEIKQKNNNWLHKYNEQDISSAIAIASKYEKSFLRFLNGNWRKLKKQIKENYDFSKHQIKPSLSLILEQLNAEYNSAKEVQSLKDELEKYYKTDDINRTQTNIDQLRSKKGDKELDYLLQHAEANDLVIRLCKLNETIYKLDNQLKQGLKDHKEKSTATLLDEIENVKANIEVLNNLLPALRSYSSLPTILKELLSSVSLSSIEAEANIANRTLKYILNHNRFFERIDTQTIERAAKQIKEFYKVFLKLNAEYIRAKIRMQFLDHMELSKAATSQLTIEQRKFKKEYNEGRKILENEFGKSMRYKSIRELATNESKQVLRDLKPVWLMSPLSVSDSLPLDVNFFDVIIFDEASQITLEEGIPSLYRAGQTIIVGDDKQMPPTNFFTARAEDPDDLELYSDEMGDELLSNDADSLLVQGSRKLNNVMLGWHYRSRYETLISFSNHAFYEAELLTIPDRTIHNKEKNNIEIEKAVDATKFSDALFDRSISFHFHTKSIYENRANLEEASYIAHLVRELLRRNIKESIGIVAFSQEQQHSIEDALTQLASGDKQFEQLLETAYNRTEEDQFIGLFVKNLENVQGDERDIIIMSVCYGFDTRKKMIMNFGPINKKGGEKRLNVIFSRAKKHMAIISSIKHFNITNEYNEGANYFKNFLHYAELVSSGNMNTARSILDKLVLNKKDQLFSHNDSVVLNEINQALVSKGYIVAKHVGQSNFRSSLAVKLNPEDEEFTLSVLLDNDHHYANPNLLEQYYQRPAILESFGWKVIFVSSKDWFLQPKAVIELIEKRLHGKIEPSQEEIKEPETKTETEIPLVEEDLEGTNIQEQNTVTSYDQLKFKRLVFADGNSNKFWEAAIDINKLIVRYGRINTKGQVQIKTFSDEATATKEMSKLLLEKLGKGYKELS